MSLDGWFAAQDAEVAAQADTVTFEVWRARYSWTRAEHIPDREVFTSHSLLDNGYALTPPVGFVERGAWSNGYRVVWTSSTERVILTYCEGDLDYEVCADSASFRAAIKRAAKFYQEMNT